MAKDTEADLKLQAIPQGDWTLSSLVSLPPWKQRGEKPPEHTLEELQAEFDSLQEPEPL